MESIKKKQRDGRFKYKSVCVFEVNNRPKQKVRCVLTTTRQDKNCLEVKGLNKDKIWEGVLSMQTKIKVTYQIREKTVMP